MGYDFKKISELQTFDFSNTSSTIDNVRISFDKTEFVVEGENISAYSHGQALDYINSSVKWINPNPICQ
jgi:hypothetical protein